MSKSLNPGREIGLKITITSIAVVILVFCSLGSLSYLSSERALKENIIKTIMSRAEDNAELVTSEVDALKKNVEGVSFWVGIDGADLEKVKPLLLREAERLGIEEFQISDAGGYARSTNGNFAVVCDNEYYLRARSGETVLMDSVVSRFSVNKDLVCATPIRGIEQNTIGVLIATLNPEYLFHIIENRKVGETGYGFMLNQKGSLIAHPNNKLDIPQLFITEGIEDKAEQEVLNELIKKMTRGEKGYMYYSFAGVEKIVAYTPVRDTGWSLALTVPKDEVFKELSVIKYRFILLTLIASIISAVFFFIILKFISQGRRLEVIQENADENARLLKQSIEQDQIKTEFFANMSHELRTPLNIILGTLQLLDFYLRGDGTFDREKLNLHIANMRQSCRRLIRLVNNIIDTTRIEAGFYEIKTSNQDIVGLVRDVTLLAADFVKGKGMELEFKSDIDEKYILCDAEKIERIILNLLSNAVKFTNPPGYITINLHDKGNTVEIYVKDTGIGIPEDKQQIIFERFRQVDKSFTRRCEGSGIGLSLVKSLVDMHHGKVQVTSELGKGSEFTVELPALQNFNADERDEEINGYTRKNCDLRDQINVEFSDIHL